MPNDFDKILRENLDALLPYIARKLLGLDLSRTETLKDKIQVTLEREGDHFRKGKKSFWLSSATSGPTARNRLSA